MQEKILNNKHKWYFESDKIEKKIRKKFKENTVLL